VGGEAFPLSLYSDGLIEREENASPSTLFDGVGGEAFSLSIYSNGPSRKRGKSLSLYSV